MGMIRDWHKERLAQELAADRSAEDANLAAGYERGRQTKAGWLANCRKRCNAKDVQARLSELRARAAELAEIDAGYVLLKAKRLLGYNLADFLSEPDANGHRYITIAAATREQLETLSELSQDEEYEDGSEDEPPTVIRKIRIKPHNQVALLELLARCLGMVRPDKVSLTDAAGDGAAKIIHEVRWQEPTDQAGKAA
jgi:hypothetical protein